MFNPELDGKGKVQPIKQHRKTLNHMPAAPNNRAMADALKRAMKRATNNPAEPATEKEE